MDADRSIEKSSIVFFLGYRQASAAPNHAPRDFEVMLLIVPRGSVSDCKPLLAFLFHLYPCVLKDS